MSDKSDVEIGILNAFSHAGALAAESASIIGCEWVRPSVLFRPTLSLDGNAWIALRGENLQIGVVGCGSSPEEAMRNFDKEWFKKVTP